MNDDFFNKTNNARVKLFTKNETTKTKYYLANKLSK